MPPLTRVDLDAQTDRLLDYIRERFELADRHADERHAGVTGRLDRLNGSVARHELAIAEIRERQAARGDAVAPDSLPVPPATPRMPNAHPALKAAGAILAAALLSLLKLLQ